MSKKQRLLNAVKTLNLTLEQRQELVEAIEDLGGGNGGNVFEIAFHMNDDIKEFIVCDRTIKYGSVTQNGSYTIFQSFEEDDINYIKNCIETATICKFNMLTYNQNLGFGYLPIASTFTNDEYNLKAFIWLDDKFYSQMNIVINNQEAYIEMFGG